MTSGDELEAGRELDALIAWHVVRCNAILKDYRGSTELFCHCDNRAHERPNAYNRISIRYSTDMQAAMGIVEWAMEQGDVFMEYWQDDEWFVCNKPVGVREGSAAGRCDGREAGSPSLPLAICRFALNLSEQIKAMHEQETV